jgi:hypothetical protein
MKLERWALIAEIASGIAILITLVILVMGVRANTNVTRAAVYEGLMSDINQFNLSIIGDPELAVLWQGDRDLESLGGEDASRLILLNRVLFRIYEAAYFSFRNGSLGPSQWERFEVTICQVKQRGDPALWADAVDVLSNEFASYVEQGCID